MTDMVVINDEIIVLFALIAVRALAEYDPVEYVRISDTSKRELDARIENKLHSMVEYELNPIMRGELESKYAQLRTITDESRGRNEAVFLLKQLHISSLERALQLSLLVQREPSQRESSASPPPPNTNALSRLGDEQLSAGEEFLRLAVMRLLRDLPGYSASFEATTARHQMDCNLVPSNDDLPIIVIEAKLRVRHSDLQRVVAHLSRTAAAWGKKTLAVLICPKFDMLELPRPRRKVQFFFLEFDVETNSFVNEEINRLTGTIAQFE